MLTVRRLPLPRTDAPDAALLAAFAATRDEGAFAEVVRRHARMVRGTARRVAGEADADDVAQAAFLILARKAGHGWGPTVGPWLYRVTARLARKARTRAARRPGPVAAEPTDPAADPCRQLLWGEVQAALDEALARLPERLRAPLVLCLLEGHTRDEAAAALGLTPDAVKGRIERGRARLRADLAARGVTLTAALAGALVAGPDGRAEFVTETARFAADHLAGGSLPPAVRDLVPLARGKAVVLLLATVVASVTFLAGSAPEPPAAPPQPRPVVASPAPGTDSYGDPLPPGAVARMGTARLRHGEWVRSVAFAPDGTELASAAFDDTVRVWDRATGRERVRLKGPFTEPHFVAYAAGGKHLVTAEGWYPRTGPNPVRVWDARSGELVRTIVGDGPRSDDAAAVSPDGATLACAIRGRVTLAPCGPGGRSGEVTPGGGRKVCHLAFSPDGTKLAVSTGRTFTGNTPPTEPFGVRVFDLDRPGEPAWRREGTSHDVVDRFPTAAFSPDGHLLLVSFNYKEQPVLFDARTGAEVRQLVGPRVAVHPALFLPGGRVFTNALDGSAVVWDTVTGRPVADWPGEWLDVLGGAALAPDGRTVATAGQRAVGLWDAATGRPTNSADGPLGSVDRVVPFPDGRRVLTGSYWDAVSGARVWEAATGRPVAALPRPATAVALAPDGAAVAAGYFRGTPELLDPATGRVVRRAGGDPCFLDSLAYGLGGEVLVGCGWTGTAVRVWDARTLAPRPNIGSFPNGGGPRAVAVTPGVRELVTAGLDGQVRVWDLSTGAPVRQFPVGGRGDYRLAVTPDGRFAVTALAVERYGFSAGGQVPSPDIQVWELATGATRQTLPGSTAGTSGLAVAPGGRAVGAAGGDGVVREYELATGQVRAVFRGHDGPVRAVAYSPDGRRLYSGGSDTTVLAWDLVGPAGGPTPTPGALWAALLDPDPAAADRAMRHLLSAPGAVADLVRRVEAMPAPDLSRVAGLVAGLDGPGFAAREAAGKELEQLGRAAIPALRAAVRATPSAEARARLEEILRRVDRPTVAGEDLRRVRAVEVLERVVAGFPDHPQVERARAALGRAKP